MDFKTAITTSSLIYRFLEKFHLENRFALDVIIDKHFPQILAQLQTYVKYSKIALCSTNGKKTTLNFLNQILEKDDKTLITNVSREGKRYPILTSIVLDLATGFKIFDSLNPKDYYTMAFDEFELSAYFNSMKFEYLLLNNLFSDQKDFCTLEEKRRKIQDAIVLNSKLDLIINADEPYFFQIDEIKNDTTLSKKRNKFYYGFNNIEFCDKTAHPAQQNDLLKCPVCSCKLDYKKVFYSHLGQYDCECGFKRPVLNLSADAKIFGDYSFLTVFYNDNKLVFKVPLGGIHNAYNALSAIACAFYLEIERKTITSAFEDYKSIKGRDDVVFYKNKNIKIKTIKNPTALSQALEELNGNKNIKTVFCLNDEIRDGIDTSWIWDANFDSLKGYENKIYTTGTRCDDMALRLKYADINPCLIVIEPSIKNAIECCYWEVEKDESMVILATPSLSEEIYKILKK